MAYLLTDLAAGICISMCFYMFLCISMPFHVPLCVFECFYAFLCVPVCVLYFVRLQAFALTLSVYAAVTMKFHFISIH